MKKNILFLLVLCLVGIGTKAQKLSSIIPSESPLVLKSQGSFYVGGESEMQTREQLGGICPDGHVTVNQMYVRYMVPQALQSNASFVLIHGMHLTGKCWETTPDGRMGWDEYLVRKGCPVYVVDQVGIGRSGFNQKMHNDAKYGKASASKQSAFSRKTDENSWMNFRFGTKDGKPVEEAKFPVEALAEFAKQNVPHITSLPSPDANYRCLSELSQQLGNAILVSHSQSGAFPIETALRNPKGIKAIVMLEPGGTGDYYTAEQIAKLKNIPILIVFGDNLKNDTGMRGHVWQNCYEGWSRFAQKVNDGGGNAQMIHLPDMGIRGNSHMMMEDKNSHQIADIVLDWCHKNKVIANGNEFNTNNYLTSYHNQSATMNIQEISDRLALKDLVDTFSNLADTKEIDQQVQLFTEDAEVTSYQGKKMTSRLKGRKELAERFKAFLDNFTTVYHINGQQTVKIDGDKATGIAYAQVVLVSEKKVGKSIKKTMLTEGVRYNDEYVRQDGRWLISKRTSHFEWAREE